MHEDRASQLMLIKKRRITAISRLAKARALTGLPL